ncbi:hypothetical protein L210DRAFT_3307660, partial [Boletus edulis BED1]
MIARCRAKMCVVQLHSDDDRCRANTQRGLRGHVIVYPQEPEHAIDILPPPIDEILNMICVIFVGSSAPSCEWLKKHARPLLVRRQRVISALAWLRLHNPYYKDTRVNDSVCSSLPVEDVLPVHIEVVAPSGHRDSLTARYDGVSQDTPSDCSSGVTSEIFESVVVTNIDASAPSHVLRAAAMEHVMKKGKAFVQIPHGRSPVGDICNPAFFPMIYPTLFPYGLGAPEDTYRLPRVSLRRHIHH